jgi:hypothetical protein
MKTFIVQVLALAAILTARNAGAALPTVSCSGSQVIHCTSSNGALAVVQAMVQDADGDPLTVIWQVNQRAVITNTLPAGITTNLVLISLTNAFPLGTNLVHVSVNDGGATNVTCDTLVVISDPTPPVIQGITATPSTLWPPNHRMVPVRLNVRATDDCGPVQWHITSIQSSEAVNAIGSGHTSPDWLVAGPHRAMLRAERSGRGPGRVYTINIAVSDLSGNTTNGSVQVTVPHSRGHGNGGNGNGNGGNGHNGR